MTYTLYGSQTSPFVRRLRMVMENIPFEFKEMNIFEKTDASKLHKINPLNQVPVLEHGNQVIWDSRVIFNYLNQIHNLQKLHWQDENLLTGIEGAISSGVALLLMKRSGLDINQPLMYIERQHQRVGSMLEYLRPYIDGDHFREWNFHSMSLYAFLDWAQFREIIDLEKWPEAREFLKRHEGREIVIKTQIPKV